MFLTKESFQTLVTQARNAPGFSTCKSIINCLIGWLGQRFSLPDQALTTTDFPAACALFLEYYHKDDYKPSFYTANANYDLDNEAH